jgi:phosphoglycolate phosphatase-like HAD superfamily hydrolase
MENSQEIRIILWDIDGTLIHQRKSGILKHVLAINKIMHTDLRSIEHASGKTDLEIIDQICKIYKIKLKHSDEKSILMELDLLSFNELSQQPSKTIPKIESTLKYTMSKKWQNGILTGNTPKRALLKLETANLSQFINFEHSFCGGQFLNRNELAEYAVQNLLRKEIKKIVIIGDSPSDITAAKLVKISAVAVATGLCSLEQLALHNPDLLLRNFENDKAKFYNFLSSFD